MQVSADGVTMHSYAFDMLDGGRHHPVAGYRDASHICEVLLAEGIGMIAEEQGYISNG